MTSAVGSLKPPTFQAAIAAAQAMKYRTEPPWSVRQRFFRRSLAARMGNSETAPTATTTEGTHRSRRAHQCQYENVRALLTLDGHLPASSLKFEICGLRGRRCGLCNERVRHAREGAQLCNRNRRRFCSLGTDDWAQMKK